MRIGDLQHHRFLARIFAVGAVALIAAAFAPRSAPADRETVLYSFCAQSGCTDGEDPFAGLLMDAVGNLYGVTEGGGAHGWGTVFEVMAPLTGQAVWRHRVLYSFCSKSACADGKLSAFAGPIRDAAGNLYGTTNEGGRSNEGTVFELTPPAKDKPVWTEKVLYSFCILANCADGSDPVAGLIIGAVGNLYGTTSAGGAYNDAGIAGTVFELKP
jgi:uncharacterized repeat protein (TIGR03803 family)